MGRIIVINPETELSKEELAGPQAASDMLSVLDKIESAGSDTMCSICGKETKLTDEHTPSKKAFNPLRSLSLTVDEKLPSNLVHWRGRQNQSKVE